MTKRPRWEVRAPGFVPGVVPEDDGPAVQRGDGAHGKPGTGGPRRQAFSPLQPVHVEDQAEVRPVVAVHRDIHVVFPGQLGEAPHGPRVTVRGDAADEVILGDRQVDHLIDGAACEASQDRVDAIQGQNTTPRPGTVWMLWGALQVTPSVRVVTWKPVAAVPCTTSMPFSRKTSKVL